ncbi:MAG: type II toxin-antitoxin system Phd/YefM family antitoxin [Acidimicrobiales bacterium]|nr:type II toxin-antitoxin system prevent-host-death family antitoxin [Actinomycetota bacterium]
MLVNIHQAKTHLSRLVDRALAGESIVIGRSGHPVARLVAYSEDQSPRSAGALRGALWVSPDFDETPSWLVGAFEGDGGLPEDGEGR